MGESGHRVATCRMPRVRVELAEWQDYRWESDRRHHFASRLVQLGVLLNTVRDLLGHSSVAMSLRYAHLAPDQRCEAVAKLDEKPLPRHHIKVSLRLPYRSPRSTSACRTFARSSAHLWLLDAMLCRHQSQNDLASLKRSWPSWSSL